MSQSLSEKVLVVVDAARVRAALTALIDATPGLQVAAATGPTADVGDIARAAGATIAVVDVDTGQADVDLAALRELAPHLAVIAVGSGADGRRALEAGAIALCDKNGDPDALTAAVTAAALGRPASARTSEDVGAGDPAPHLPNGTTH